MRTYEEVRAEYEKLVSEQNAHMNAFQCNDMNNFFKEWEEHLAPIQGKVSAVSRELRMLQEPVLDELPDYGDVMSLSEFIECCESGGFIDYDGSGEYVIDNMTTGITIYPSDVKHGSIRTEFKTIVWYNR